MREIKYTVGGIIKKIGQVLLVMLVLGGVALFIAGIVHLKVQTPYLFDEEVKTFRVMRKSIDSYGYNDLYLKHIDDDAIDNRTYAKVGDLSLSVTKSWYNSVDVGDTTKYRTNRGNLPGYGGQLAFLMFLYLLYAVTGIVFVMGVIARIKDFFYCNSNEIKNFRKRISKAIKKFLDKQRVLTLGKDDLDAK